MAKFAIDVYLFNGHCPYNCISFVRSFWLFCFVDNDEMKATIRLDELKLYDELSKKKEYKKKRRERFGM